MSSIEVRVVGGVAWLRARAGRRDDRTVAGDLSSAVEALRLDERVSLVALSAARGAGFFFTAPGSAGTTPEVGAAIEAVAAISQPVIGALAGATIGDAGALALACDLRIAARGSYLAFPQMSTGVLPSCGATQRLPRLIGRTRALELLLSGRRLGAMEARRIGLVSLVVEAARLDSASRAFASGLAAKGPVALRFAKEAVWKGLDLTLQQGIHLEQDLYVLLQTTADRAAGVRAFRSGRTPRYRGR